MATKKRDDKKKDLGKGIAKLLTGMADQEAGVIEIRGATIKDDLCNYDYEIVKGKSRGFTHGVKGKGIVDDDMNNAFAKLNVHLAVVDDIFKHSGIEIGDIDTMHTDELATLYEVTAFKIKGGEENEAIILIGNKYISGGSRMALESPKITMDELSSYKWHNELKAAADLCREEVVLYHEGKYTPVKKEEEEQPDANQLKITMSVVPGEKNTDQDEDIQPDIQEEDHQSDDHLQTGKM